MYRGSRTHVGFELQTQLPWYVNKQSRVTTRETTGPTGLYTRHAPNTNYPTLEGIARTVGISQSKCVLLIAAVSSSQTACADTFVARGILLSSHALEISVVARATECPLFPLKEIKATRLRPKKVTIIRIGFVRDILNRSLSPSPTLAQPPPHHTRPQLNETIVKRWSIQE